MCDGELLALLKRAEAICKPDADGVFSEIVNAFGRLMGERDKAVADLEECRANTIPRDFYERFADLQAKQIVQLSLELAAAKRVLQRFSYDNTHKCRWCKFSKPAVMGRVICDHPALHVRHKEITDALPFYPHCTRFEYEYKEENEK